MKPFAALLVAFLAAGPSLPFFKYVRPSGAAPSAGQHYVVVDETLWQHARPGLFDLRLYSAGAEVPYELRTETGGTQTGQQELRVLQPATVAGETQFLLDMAGVSEYDRVELKLGARNFVAHARIEGQDDPHASRWAVLGNSTLFDLSAEELGHSTVLQIPATTYKYLRVRIVGPVKPSDVQGATAGITRSQTAVWRTLASEAKISQQGKDTVVTFTLPPNVPVERLVFDIAAEQPNFRRDIEVQGDLGRAIAFGEISRVHLQRGGEKIDTEQASLALRTAGPQTLKATILNGDDPPLEITSAHLEQYERRIYFDAPAGASCQFYYGDSQLFAPVYDYAKLFQQDPGATPVALAAEQPNPAFAGRPDQRPWSERHPALLWAAIIAAVLILGAIALRSMRRATA